MTDSALHNALDTNDLDALRELFVNNEELKSEIVMLNEQPMYLLAFAICIGNLPMVRLLVELAIWPDDETYRNILDSVVEQGASDEMCFALVDGVQLENPELGGMFFDTAVTLAIEARMSHTVIERLVRAQPEADVADVADSLVPPLYSATWMNDEATIRLLVRLGEDLNRGDDLHLRPIHIATTEASVLPSTLKTLIDLGAQVDGQELSNVESVEKARILLNSNTSIEFALQSALRNQRPAVVKAVIEVLGIECVHEQRSFRTSSNITLFCPLPLVDALRQNREQNVVLLLACGADPNVDGCMAACSSSTQATLLFAAGAREPENARLKWRRADLSAGIPAAERRLMRARLYLIRARATEICFAMQTLQLPALLTLMLIDEACPLASAVPMHLKWKLITAVKHAQHN
jgi:hypothetical protein